MKYMKYLGFCMLIIASACNNNKPAEEKQLTSNTSTESQKVENTSAAPGNEAQSDIVGEWELKGVIADLNNNDILDPNERELLVTGAIDYMKLNSDGTASMLVTKTKGRYEIRKNESTGRNHLYLYDQSGTEYKKGFIMSVTKDELQIMHQFGGNSITLWKRL